MAAALPLFVFNGTQRRCPSFHPAPPGRRACPGQCCRFPHPGQCPGGKQRGCLDGLLKGHAEGNQVFDFLVQVGDGAGDGAVGQQCLALVDGDHLAAQVEGLALRHAVGPHGVADDKRPVPQQPEGGPQHRRVDVEAVANQFAPDTAVVEHGAHHAGLPVVEAAHGVEQVGGVGDALVKGGLGLVVVRGGVGDGHGAQLAGLLCKRIAARLLRGDIHQRTMPPLKS